MDWSPVVISRFGSGGFSKVKDCITDGTKCDWVLFHSAIKLFQPSIGNLLSQSNHSTNSEKDLWVAVLFQAFRDAVRLKDLEAKERRAIENNRKVSPAVVRELEAAREAMLWLTIPSQDLYEVCEMAEVSAECVLDSREELEAGTLTQFKTWTFQ